MPTFFPAMQTWTQQHLHRNNSLIATLTRYPFIPNPQSIKVLLDPNHPTWISPSPFHPHDPIRERYKQNSRKIWQIKETGMKTPSHYVGVSLSLCTWPPYSQFTPLHYWQPQWYSPPLSSTSTKTVLFHLGLWSTFGFSTSIQWCGSPTIFDHSSPVKLASVTSQKFNYGNLKILLLEIIVIIT